MKWNCYDTPFIVENSPEIPRQLTVGGAWSGHRRFAYDLIRNSKPRMVVELGTFYGTSFFSFCQGARDENRSTHCFAIDTWQGDPHSGKYDHIGEQIFQAVQAVTTREFPTIGTLVRCEFDTALPYFAMDCIDVLHIDGYHTYEAVHHDYTTWYPKLAPNGVVLFHDIAVRANDFGVYRFWAELSGLPHIEFPHSHGLGVLFPKGVPDYARDLLDSKNALISHYIC
ncbi:class I SAM-dependent methyltransferase [Paenibacillus taiwanensis]|uniref:class I SAM-dependent methyltransferase n=1 Tax=Paenibacillus taiwanensis TaxID=401638 RepID=UPI00041D7F21|nr:class I SAM-dependent methyltransferase [Paenibacillus taiwanensis]